MSETEVFIISWPAAGVEKNAEHIAGVLTGHCNHVNVIYSTADEMPRGGSGNWIQVSDKKYYGHKFAEILNISRGGRLLQIHADALHDDWVRVVNAFDDHCDANEHAGVWAPDIDYTFWRTADVIIAKTNDATAYVAQTDCTVWGLTRRVVHRLKQLNYSGNNFGWGIDWAAICFAYVNNMTVVRDLSTVVFHPRGSGYANDQATTQLNAFLGQLTLQEKIAYRMLSACVDHRKILQRKATARPVSAEVMGEPR
ncbi:MAG: hypothetical protein QE285_19535 [Aquabacterium sp.]|nr:hypothetical protein [Aquabacterium sp.]